MKSLLPLRLFGALTLAVGMFAGRPACAFEIDVSGGGTYNQVSQDSLASSGKSSFTGFGLEGELRAKVYRTSSRKFGIELFGAGTTGTYKNTFGETNNRHTYGGGMDLALGPFFLGGQVEGVQSTVTAASSSAKLNYLQYGPRAGIRLNLTRRLALSLGGIASFGSTPIEAVSGPTTSRSVDYRGFVLLQIRLYQSAAAAALWRPDLFLQ